MATYGNITFRGKSGERYHFQAWPLATRFRSVGAVYFVTKRAFNDQTYRRRACHEAIFIGQTGNLAEPFGTHLQLGCFSKHGANCVCVYLDANEGRRLAAEQDLIDGQSPSCN